MADENKAVPQDRAAVGGGRATTLNPTGIFASMVAGFAQLANRGMSWFGAGKPIAPIAQEVMGRQMDFPSFSNINTNTPRGEELVSFQQLRNLADNFDVLRIVIETRKDQIARLNWSIKPKDSTKKPDKRCEDAMAFFAYPDKIHTWDDWVRMILEDMLVLDAPVIYPRKTNGGQLYALEIIDGATMRVLIDDSGRRPVPPEAAYAQVLKGVPAVHYTSEELIYKPRNPRPHKVYGYGPVEQIIMTVQIALNRQLAQLGYFTDGTMPDAVAGVPESWGKEQIKEWQSYVDELLADPTKKRKVRFMPKATADSFKEIKPAPLKDMFDEWLARIVCYTFSVEVTPFVAQVNRAVADTNREQSLAEGREPTMRWVKSLVDLILHKYMGWDDLEFNWDEEEEINPKTQAEIDQIYLSCGVLSVATVQKRLGLDNEEEAAGGVVVNPAAEPKLGPDGKPLPAEAPAPQMGPDGKLLPVDQNAVPSPTAPAAGNPAAVAGSGQPNVQATALNGTQITSLQGIIQAVIDEAMPLETARALIGAAFPMLTAEQIEGMLAPTVGFEAKEPVMAGGFDADGNPIPAGDDQAGDAGSDEEKPEGEGGAMPPKKKPKAVPPAQKGMTVQVVLPEIRQPDVYVEVGGTTVNATIDGTKQTAHAPRSEGDEA